MNFTPLDLDGVVRIDLERRGDDRGFFARVFCADEFAQQGLNTSWVQMNTSYSHLKGTLRGLHFQRPPKAEVKLVRCLKGAIWDVVVDLREGSGSYGRHVAVELNDDNRAMLYIPQGFAHGFQTLTPDTELLYWHSEVYSPDCEGGLHHADAAVGVSWPLPPSQVSDRDQGFPTLDALEPIRL